MTNLLFLRPHEHKTRITWSRCNTSSVNVPARVFMLHLCNFLRQQVMSFAQKPWQKKGRRMLKAKVNMLNGTKEHRWAGMRSSPNKWGRAQVLPSIHWLTPPPVTCCMIEKHNTRFIHVCLCHIINHKTKLNSLWNMWNLLFGYHAYFHLFPLQVLVAR